MKSQESQPDRNRRAERYDTLWSGFLEFWETRLGLAVGFLLVSGIAAALLFGQLGELGIWEPWEANEILVAQEYQDRPDPPSAEELGPREPSYNWAVPTKDRKPIARSPLKIWLMSLSLVGGVEGSGQPRVGALEFSARGPFALAALLLTVLGFFWLRDVFDTWSAVLGSLAFVSAPAIYVGAHTVSAEMLYVVTTSLAILAFAKFVFSEGLIRALWGALFGVGLALTFLDQRFFGILVPLGTIAVFAVAQLPYLQATEFADSDESAVGLLEKILAVAALLAGAAFAAWGFWISARAGTEGLLLPWVKQLFAVFLPLAVIIAALLFAWKSRVVRAFRSLGGFLGLLLALAICVAAVFPVLEAYADANPTLLKHGEIFGTIPVLEFILRNDLYGAGPTGNHPHFAMWFRQIGFSMVPWAAFVPLGLGYLAHSTRLTDDTGAIREGVADEADSVRRLLLIWSFVGIVVVGAGSLYGHYYIPVYYPLLVSAGVMFGDADFWRRARLDSLLQYFMGFAALAIIFMLAKDLQRFPPRFLEPYMMFESSLGLPDDFRYGAILDGLKYTWVIVAATFFFGLASRALHRKYRDVFVPLFFFAAIEVPVQYWSKSWDVGVLVVDFTELGSLTMLLSDPTRLAFYGLQFAWLAIVAALPLFAVLTWEGDGHSEFVDEYLLDCTWLAWGFGLAGAFAVAFVRGGDAPAIAALLAGPLAAPTRWLSLLALAAAVIGTVAYGIYRFEVIVEWFGRRWSNLAELFSDSGSPMEERALEKEHLRREPGVFGSIVRLFETPQTFGAILVLLFVGSAGIVLHEMLPRLGNHLSQRGIFESYTRVRGPETKLYRLQVSTRETSVYLRAVPRLKSTNEFIEKFDSDERFFAVIPRDQLSSLNSQIRKQYDRDIPVLDARSSKILLVSNQLSEDETNRNFVAESIVDDPSVIEHQVTFEHQGESKHPVFDNRLKLLGYTLDHDGKVPAYSWGETAELTTYFKVLRPVPSNQKIFLHVDYPGSRIHGDHYPMGGDFPTSDWPKGAIVKDEYNLKIDPYSSTGEYTMFFGFYRAGQRMQVRPPSAHDGQNRVPMGEIRVTGF